MIDVRVPASPRAGPLRPSIRHGRSRRRGRPLPTQIVGLVERALAARAWSLDGARVAILGVAIRSDPRDAPTTVAGVVMTRLADLGAEVRFHDPRVAAFRDVAGVEHRSSDLVGIVRWADVVVVMTLHAAIDRSIVYSQAELVVDMVDSSRGVPVHPGQVLRLGAGWSSRA